MAKRITETQAIVSKLVIGKEDIKKKIQERIEIGKELIMYNVRIIPNNSYTRTPRVKYDEGEQSEFFSTFKKWDNFNIELLKHAFNNIENEYKKEYENSYSMASMFGSDDIVNDQKKTIQKRIDTLESFIERLEIIPSETIEPQVTSVIGELTNKVFIVHGHNDLIKQITARTLSQLGLEPIILHEQPDGGKTVIEKFEKNSSDIGFAVILLTNDDIGKAKTEADYKARARQNVIFEMGYFIGKLGRERVLLLLDSGVEKPGDIDGIVYTPIDAHDGWKLKLVKELKACGYRVSADNI
ncbi:MAG: nucleotide-binding protein [Bacteroidales bacterium]|nr:nucleotide-binding protein [Bacteroidales bacterium]